MITIDGYSKDPNICPNGIVITMGAEMINFSGGLKSFIKKFDKFGPDELWLQKCKNKPAMHNHIQYVYVIIANRLAYRFNYLGYSNQPTEVTRPNGEVMQTQWPYLILAGPLIKCPYKRTLKGFQGFRYSTFLF